MLSFETNCIFWMLHNHHVELCHHMEVRVTLFWIAIHWLFRPGRKCVLEGNSWLAQLIHRQYTKQQPRAEDIRDQSCNASFKYNGWEDKLLAYDIKVSVKCNSASLNFSVVVLCLKCVNTWCLTLSDALGGCRICRTGSLTGGISYLWTGLEVYSPNQSALWFQLCWDMRSKVSQT